MDNKIDQKKQGERDRERTRKEREKERERERERERDAERGREKEHSVHCLVLLSERRSWLFDSVQELLYGLQYNLKIT